MVSELDELQNAFDQGRVLFWPRMPAELTDALLRNLATEPGLFHRGSEGEALSGGITEMALRALESSLSPGMRTLETGCGGTTIVFAATGAVHTVVTPAKSEADRVRDFCDKMGISLESVEFRIGSSDTVLVGWDEPLDAVLIDGAHRFPFPMIDWHYVAGPLKVGGDVWVDDIAIPAVYRLFEFLRGESEWQLVAVHDDKLAQFKKIANPAEPYPLDWELQRYNDPSKWVFSYMPLSRRWRIWRNRAMIGTRIRQLRQELNRRRGGRRSS